MPGPTFATLSLDELARQPARRSAPQTSDRAYLISIGLVAAVIIGVFFGIGFSLLAPLTEQLIDGLGTRDRGAEVKPLRSSVSPYLYTDARSSPIEAELPRSAVTATLPVAPRAQSPAAREALTPENSDPVRGSVSPAREALVSAVTGASSGTEVPALKSISREATPAPPATVSPSASSFPVATTSATPPASSRLTAAEVAELLARGDSFISIGDIASARFFYGRAADAGDGQAALRMGATFDPAFLSRAGLRSTLGDPAQARSWYRHAFAKAERRRNGLGAR
jgi:hypothetical protein